MGLGWIFLSVDWFTACSDSENGSTSNLTTSSVCASRVYQNERVVIIIGLPVPWVCLLCQCATCARECASMPEGHPEVVVLPWMFLRGPRCPEGQDIVPLCQMAQIPQDCTYGSDSFVMMIFDCFSLSSDSLLAVFVTINCFKSIYSLIRLGFVMEDNMLSLCWRFSIVHS